MSKSRPRARRMIASTRCSTNQAHLSRSLDPESPLSKIEITAFLGIITVCAFLASLAYVEGLSRYLKYDLKPYLAIQDYIQITASWALNGFWILLVSLGIVFVLLYKKTQDLLLNTVRDFLQRNNLIAVAAIFSAAHNVLIEYLRERSLPVIRLIRVEFFACFIGLVLLGTAYSTGRNQVPTLVRKSQISTVQVSESHHIFDGKIILLLSRYLILLRDEGGLTILPQSSIVSVLTFPKSK
jgi:hypothetical protein